MVQNCSGRIPTFREEIREESFENSLIKSCPKVRSTPGESSIKETEEGMYPDKDIFNGVKRMGSRLKSVRSENQVKA